MMRTSGPLLLLGGILALACDAGTLSDRRLGADAAASDGAARDAQPPDRGPAAPADQRREGLAAEDGAGLSDAAAGRDGGGAADAAPSGWSLGQVPFAPSSSWNTAIPPGASFAPLAWPAASGGNYWVNWEAYAPAVHVSQPSDPLVRVAIPDNWGWPAGEIAVRLPAGVTGAAGTDGEILIIDGTTAHNFWQFERTGSATATAQAYGRADVVTDSGWGSSSPFRSAGIVATGSSQLAGLLVQAETDAGEIEHALQIALDSQLQRPGHTGEAIGGDGSNPGGIAQEGERFAIPPAVAMPGGLSPLGQKVFRALQKYGAFDIDVAGGTTVLRAQANAFDAAAIDGLRSDVPQLIPLLQRVSP